MHTGVFTPNTLIQALSQLQSKQLTGKLVITGGKPFSEVWCIYFHLGRIVWATGGQHQTRRWFRALKQYCPMLLTEEWFQKAINIAGQQPGDDNAWKMQMLVQALQEKVINLPQAKAVVQQCMLEVLFGVFNQFYLQTSWVPWKDIPQSFVWLYLESVVQEAMTQSTQWSHVFSRHRQDLPIGFSPDFAIVAGDTELLRSKISPNTYQTLMTLLNGQNTFWDIASALDKSLIMVAKWLLPLIHSQAICLKKIPDRSDPTLELRLQATLTTNQPQLLAMATPVVPVAKGLIACVDDSPLIGEALEAILKPLGYEVLSILDPLQGMSTLLRRQPKLIFLDLVMPNTNGYELCTFLRKSTVFRDTPIVMLTGRDGVLDRLRAKMSGSSDFLGKPPEPTKVLQVVQKFLGDGCLGEKRTTNQATEFDNPNELLVQKNLSTLAINHQLTPA